MKVTIKIPGICKMHAPLYAHPCAQWNEICGIPTHPYYVCLSPLLPLLLSWSFLPPSNYLLFGHTTRYWKTAHARENKWAMVIRQREVLPITTTTKLRVERQVLQACTRCLLLHSKHYIYLYRVYRRVAEADPWKTRAGPPPRTAYFEGHLKQQAATSCQPHRRHSELWGRRRDDYWMEKI